MEKSEVLDNFIDTICDQFVLISLYHIDPMRAMWEVKEKKARVGVPFLKIVRNGYYHGLAPYDIDDVIIEADYLSKEVYDFVKTEKGEAAAAELFCRRKIVTCSR